MWFLVFGVFVKRRFINIVGFPAFLTVHVDWLWRGSITVDWLQPALKAGILFLKKLESTQGTMKPSLKSWNFCCVVVNCRCCYFAALPHFCMQHGKSVLCDTKKICAQAGGQTLVNTTA